ncbi:AraC family transcriptional regulator [Parapedobacter soli]
MLKTTNLTVTEIGYHTGFDSPFYFSRLFKKKFGVSPKSLRASHI